MSSVILKRFGVVTGHAQALMPRTRSSHVVAPVNQRRIPERNTVLTFVAQEHIHTALWPF